MKYVIHKYMYIAFLLLEYGAWVGSGGLRVYRNFTTPGSYQLSNSGCVTQAQEVHLYKQFVEVTSTSAYAQ